MAANKAKATKIILKDPNSGRQYTLEYTRETVVEIERAGFKLDELKSMPGTMLPILFWGAFRAHKSKWTMEQSNELYDQVKGMDLLINKLIEMYSDVVLTLMGKSANDEDENSEDGEDEKNVTWAVE